MGDESGVFMDETRRRLVGPVRPLQPMKDNYKKVTSNDPRKTKDLKHSKATTKENSNDENYKREYQASKTKASYEPYQAKKSRKTSSSDVKNHTDEKRDHKQIQYCLTVTEESYKVGDTTICKTKTDCKPYKVASNSATYQKNSRRDKNFEQSKSSTTNVENYKQKGIKVSKNKANYKPYSVKMDDNIEIYNRGKIAHKREDEHKSKLAIDSYKQKLKSTSCQEICPVKSYHSSNTLSSSVSSKTKSDSDRGRKISHHPMQKQNSSSYQQGQYRCYNGKKNEQENGSFWQKKHYQEQTNGRSYTNKQKQTRSLKKKNENLNVHESSCFHNERKKIPQNDSQRYLEDEVNDYSKICKQRVTIVDIESEPIEAPGEGLIFLNEESYEVVNKDRSETDYDKDIENKHSVLLNSREEKCKSICAETLEYLISAVELNCAGSQGIEFVNSPVQQADIINSILLPKIDDAPKFSQSSENQQTDNSLSLSLSNDGTELNKNILSQNQLTETSLSLSNEGSTKSLGDCELRNVDCIDENGCDGTIREVTKMDETLSLVDSNGISEIQIESNWKNDKLDNLNLNEYDSRELLSPILVEESVPLNREKKLSETLQNNVTPQINTLSIEQMKIIKKIDNKRRVQGIGILECPCSLSLDGERIGFCDAHELICQT